MLQRIKNLKEQHNAVILAHYYQEPEIQDIADFVGDSLELSRKAAATDADVILFCGVHFMAETAKIVNPGKKVIIPDMDAGCSLADGAPAERFKKWVDKHPDHTVISYINCSAEVKALSDIICTSANAKKIVESIPKDKKILFAPDKFLGRYVMKETGRDMVLWDGSCQVHEIFSERELVRLKVQHEEAKVLAHPECEENILVHADFIGSTSALIKNVNETNDKKYIIATEPGVIHQMQKQNPEKKFIPLPANNGCACNECPHMRLNTTEKIIDVLSNLKNEITLDEDTRVKALKPINRMLEIV
jgi:quinolinate synthase